MRDAFGPSDREGFACAGCGRFIVTAVADLWRNPSVGSPRRFCDPACRQAAYRRRRAGIAEDAPRQQTGGRGRSLRPTSERGARHAGPSPDDGDGSSSGADQHR
ncbi:MAG: hypothetical protein M0T79_05200 [Actinomycetota bacterium]|nr:hypothetical protein [Actinomycetota bacterium]